ncbi:hypothetical protein [Synechococcus sp. MIT S9509]|uniref:hypothetical protein n=1 Tax=Synechococcus sp. MIT S9509 TaxID=1801630 RepID=UPI0012E91E05|nr:hypothetical protein [Synechococcus sp. MIT S9509]
MDYWYRNIMEKFLKSIAVFSAIAVALFTGSLYVRSIRNDIHSQDNLNRRLNELCEQARQSNWTEANRSKFLKRNCEQQHS